MGAAYFYHLTHASLEQTLPMLLGKALQAGWQVELRGTEAAIMERLDDVLWQGPPDGFLPHGLAGGAHDADQPILLTHGPGAANAPTCLMAVSGAEVSAQEVEQMQRVCIIFDGNNGSAVADARVQWKTLTGAGCSAQYWSQEDGAWEKKAER